MIHVFLMAACACAVAVGPAAAGQQGAGAEGAALRDRVGQLVERLGASSAEARGAARAGLIKLGPRVLPLLPAEGALPAGERKNGVEQVRAALRKANDDVRPEASRVTIEGKGIRLSEALRALQKQTGNAITDMREQMGVEAANPALDLAIREKPFLEALDLIAREAKVGVEFYTGDGSVGIAAGGAPDETKPPEKAEAAAPVVYTGPFRAQLKQIAAVRDFATGTSTATVQFTAAWEPRLRPMLLKLESDRIAVVDDHGRKVEAQAREESSEVVIRPENPIAEINLNLKAPDRSAARLKSLHVQAEVTIPAGIKLFRFPSLAGENVTMKQGDVQARLVGTEIDEQVWKVNVELVYPGEGPAFESYRQGLFNNRLWLERADGSRFEHNGGFSSTGGQAGRLGFEYLFVDAPGKPADYRLVYETPSKVVTVPLEFTFRDVALP